MLLPKSNCHQLKRWVEEPHNCEICDFGKTRKTIRDKTAQLAIEQYCANGRTAQLAIIRLIDILSDILAWKNCTSDVVSYVMLFL